MKRLIIITAVAVLLSCLLSPVFAVELTGKVTVEAADGNGADGEYTFTVSVAELLPLHSVRIVPTFDGDVFELGDGAWITEAPLTDFSLDEGDGVALWHEPTTLSGDVFTFTLRLKSGDAEGTYSVGCEFFVIDEEESINGVSDVTVAAVELGCRHDFSAKSTDAKYRVEGSDNTYYVSCTKCGEAGSETFTVTLPGDVNGDGRVNAIDVSLVLKYIARWDVPADPEAADVTGEGNVNLADASLILKYIAGWDVELV